ncbi:MULTISPECIES: NAD(P)/FAD-dependent oxidoreductase [Pseudonocardia]|uniref:N-methyltryptophan oxidase n=1 Tax=Pseudonocardia autotrophica TaxID=2074 RepID=A0A1Y2MJP6_PSEAH|nr:MULTISPECIES: FAD-dependent oxidoreductase [Pseudonocardia]OSY35229.1 N-methyltryptophan oxidase [Pseudonocardia autotrophica]TDN73167.1 glycine/D-amino acid oxidase-like deaminating enzyme [Pseudonocardia autotrophica]
MRTDAVVIGAGVVGSSIALELARGGRQVVVVDKAGGVGHGSTSASSAVVRFNFSTRAGVAAAWESRFAWEAWADHLGGEDPAGMTRYVRTGLAFLDVAVAPRSMFVPHLERAGVPFEEWDAATLAQRIPGIDVGRYWPPKPIADERFFDEAEGTVGAVHTPDAGYVSDPQLAARNLAWAAERHGARFLLRRAVTAIERGARVRAVLLDDGTRIDADVVVNAAGPWSSAINRLAGVGSDFTISLTPMRQEVAHVRAPAGRHPEGGEGISVADMDLGIYLRGEVGGGLLIGGTEPECDPFQWLECPDDAHPNPTMEVFEAQAVRAARRLPELRVPHRARGVVGVYDVADDWTPVYDRTDLPGFYVAIGTSGNQFKNAPVVGRFMTAIIDRVEGGGDHDTDPVQFVAERTGAVIDLAAFSRRRAVNTDSSRTVMG